jgi:glycosyltransferase involved in cell wall biosynthesis
MQKALDDDALLGLYNRAKLVVYAPYLEPFGLVPLEAMACGTPVVGVREGGVRESIVDGVTGLLTDRDEREFAVAVHRLLASPETAAEMGQNGVRHVAGSWTLEHAAARLLRHLERAAEEGRAR